MHRDVDAAVQERLFDLAREQALAADLFQRLVKDLVAGDLDHHDRERRLGQRKGLHQTSAHLMRLPQRKWGTSGADLQRLGGGRKRMTHAPSLTCVIFA